MLYFWVHTIYIASVWLEQTKAFAKKSSMNKYLFVAFILAHKVAKCLTTVKLLCIFYKYMIIPYFSFHSVNGVNNRKTSK